MTAAADPRTVRAATSAAARCTKQPWQHACSGTEQQQITGVGRVGMRADAAQEQTICWTVWGTAGVSLRQSAAGPSYAKLETVVLRETSPEIDSVTVRSLIARYSDGELEQEFPELGGFAMPCVREAYTAINKLDALHRRAASGDPDE